MKIDLGCGPVKREGFIGVDKIAFPGVDIILDIGSDPWPWKDNSVEEVWCSHTLEHLKPMERVHFANELYRVMSPTAEATIVTPHWASQRAYGDVTHEWPPVSPFWYNYLNKDWRLKAQHGPEYTCDFVFEAKATMNPEFVQLMPDMQHMAPMILNALDDLVVRVKKVVYGES